MKVLFVTENKLMHYRMPIFRLVNNDPDIDLTLAHSEGSIIQNEIKEIIIPNDKIIGPFNRYKNFRQICSEYDVVLCMAYYNNLAILKELICRKKTYKIILWGIGVRASYQHKFGAKSPYGKMIKFFSKRADALLFYSDFPIPLYCNYGIEKERLFVANNTVEVIHQNMDISSKDRFLFVGTLYKEKGIDVLINAYSQAFSIDKNILRLTIIGDGDRIKYEKLVKELVNNVFTDFLCCTNFCGISEEHCYNKHVEEHRCREFSDNCICSKPYSELTKQECACNCQKTCIDFELL